MNNSIIILKTLLLTTAIAMFSSCSDDSSGDQAKGNRAADQNQTFFMIGGDGNLKRPDSYRKWVYVGTPTTPNDMNNGKAPFPEFHNVYIDPVSYDHWKEHGEWREGTILVKELVSVGSKAAVSGKGYFMGEFIGLEATIKSKQHFPDEPGNWAYFSFTNPTGTELKDAAAPFETQDCNSCHDASAKDDFVFTQYYPVLRAAKGFGQGRPESSGKVKAIASPGEAPDTSQLDDKWKATAPTPAGEFGGAPMDKEALFAWLKAGDYKTYANKESKPHPSEGPHTAIDLPVQVFMNNIVAASLSAANAEHPEGSAIVKEMFSEAGVLSGWAVMVKTQAATESGKGWFWYEVTSASDASKIAAIGNGVSGCAKCHSNGTDMVLSQFPLR